MPASIAVRGGGIDGLGASFTGVETAFEPAFLKDEVAQTVWRVSSTTAGQQSISLEDSERGTCAGIQPRQESY